MTTRTSIARLADDAPVAHPDSWPARKPPSIAVQGAHPSTAAYDDACAAISTQAARTVRRAIKDRARDYLEEPWQLDFLGPQAIWASGFIASAFTPDQLICFAKEVLRQELEFCEKMAPHRIELVPVKNWNARAAIVAGRYRRAKARQIARRSA